MGKGAEPELVPPRAERLRLVAEYAKVKGTPEGREFTRRVGYNAKTLADWGRVKEAKAKAEAQAEAQAPKKERRAPNPTGFQESRFTQDERDALVIKYKQAIASGEIGAGNQVAKEAGLSSAHIIGWASSKGFAERHPEYAHASTRSHRRPGGRGPNYPAELRDKALALYVAGKQGRAIAEELNINMSSVFSWVNQAGLTRNPRVPPGTYKGYARKNGGDPRRAKAVQGDLVELGNKALSRMNGHRPSLAARGVGPEGLIRQFIEALHGRGTKIESINVEGTTCTYRIVGSFEL